MRNRRWVLAGAAAVAAMGLTLTACGGEKTPASSANGAGTATTAPADPKQVLVASVKEIDKGNFKFTMTGDGLTGGGQVHSPTKSAEMKMEVKSDGFGMKMDLVHIQPDSWIKMDVDLGELGQSAGGAVNTGKWMHLDQSKISTIKDLAIDFDDIDPAGAGKIFDGVVSVQKTGEGTYTGTVDLNKAKDAGMLDEDLIKALGTKAATMPFEAKVDGQGRLTSLSIDVPAAGETKAHKLQVTYSDYGAASQPQKPPASEVIEAPADVYEMFK